MADEHDGPSITLSPAILWGIMLGSAGIGAGGFSALSPQMEREALRKCFDNSEIALEVAAQHGQEMQTMREIILERTRDLYRTDTADSDWRQQRKIDELQNQRLEFLERNQK